MLFRLFYEFPSTPFLITTEIFCALLISIIGITCPLLITNNISSSYYKSVFSSIQDQMKQQVTHYERMVEANGEIRKFRHDYKNLQIGLRSYLREGDAEGALAYLKDTERLYITDYIHFETGNTVADALLSEKQAAAAKVGANIEFDGVIPSDVIEFSDLCIILGNALDNAVEACAKIPDEENKVILVKTYLNNNFLFMTIRNPSSGPVAIRNNHVGTTKKDKQSHGIGLYSIQHAVEHYGGKMTVSAEGNDFVLEICLDLNDAVNVSA